MWGHILSGSYMWYSTLICDDIFSVGATWEIPHMCWHMWMEILNE
jgi:hypothetical protein